MVDTDNMLGQGRGAIYAATAFPRTSLYLSPSLGEFVARYTKKILTGQIEVFDNTLNGFERDENSSDATTEGIWIHARSKFIPTVQLQGYLWAYQIHIAPAAPT